MKIALIGAGGMRAPLFVGALMRRADAIHVDRIALFDVDADRLRLLGGLARSVAERSGARLRAVPTDDLDEALDGASFVVTSIRPGGDAGRILDERIALDHGVLGQETVGAGGFAMALRTAPALSRIAERTAAGAPDAWTLHFTNPAGLVTQILHDAGHARQLGICDSPTDLVRRVAAFLGADPGRLVPRVVGLNHLSWLTALLDGHGHDLLPALLADARFVAEVARPFEGPRLKALGALPSEYLHYYEHHAAALAAQRSAPRTRGESIAEANRSLLADLASLDPTGRFDRTLDAALERFAAYSRTRETSYKTQIGRDGEAAAADPGEGYAGVALDVMTALGSDTPRDAVLSTPNRGAIPWLRDDDVIETSALLDRRGAHPVEAPRLAPDVVEVLGAVKEFERRASEAIRTRDRRAAARALDAHPLVGPFTSGTELAAAYLHVHAAHCGDWPTA